MITLESSCCQAHARVEGHAADRHYVCSACGNSCLAATVCTFTEADAQRVLDEMGGG
jgi:hypothetical protein